MGTSTPSAARFSRYLVLNPGALQIPEKSGLPSRVLGAGADRSAFPFLVRGIPGAGWLIHCAAAGSVMNASTEILRKKPTLVRCISPPHPVIHTTVRHYWLA